MNVEAHIADCWIVNLESLWDVYTFYPLRLADQQIEIPDYAFFEFPPMRYRSPKYRWWMFTTAVKAHLEYRRALKQGRDAKPVVFQAFGEHAEAPSVQHLDLGDLRIVNCSKRTIAIRCPGSGLRSRILPSGELERESFRALWASGKSPKTTVFLFPEWLDLGVNREPRSGALQYVTYNSPADRLVRGAIADGASEECRFDFCNLTPKQVWRDGSYLAIRVATDDGYRWVEFP